MLYEAVIIFVLHIALLGIFAFAARRQHMKEHSDWWMLVAIRVYQQGFCPLMLIPQCFRIVYLVGEWIDEFSALVPVSLVFQFLSLVILAWNSLLSSIFLDPLDIEYGGMLDVFDGKSSMGLFFARVLFVIGTMFTDMTTYEQYPVICAVLCFLVFAFLFYYRAMNTVHVSWFGEFVELGPLLVLPVVVLVHAYASQRWEWRVLVILAVNVIVALAVFLKRRVMVRKAVAMMCSLTEAGSEQSVSGFNMASVLRLFYLYYPNPAIADKYMALQKKVGLKASVLVELVRFLAVFPSRREALYDEIVGQDSRSTVNSWMLYLLAKRLYGLTESAEVIQKESANRLYRGLLVSIHEYWQSRHKRLWWRSLKYAMHTTYYFIETKAELQSLLYRFPFDPQVHAQMAEFCLSACGSYELYKQHKTMADSLEHNKWAVNDPILRMFFRERAVILKYCNEEDSKSLNLFGQTSTNSSTHSNYQTATTAASTLELFGGNVATLIEESRRVIDIGFSRSFLYVIILLVSFVALINPSINKLTSLCVNLDRAVVDCSRQFYLSGSLLYFGRMLNESGNYHEPGIDNETLCMKNWFLAPEIVTTYFGSLPLISGFGTSLLTYYFDNPQGYPDNNGSFCPYILYVMRWVIQETGVQREKMSDALDVMYADVNAIGDQVRKGYLLYDYEMWLAVAFGIMEFFFYVVLFISLNVIDWHPNRVRRFLISKQRLALLLLERSEQSWELLRAFLPGSTIAHEDIMKLNDSSGLPLSRRTEAVPRSTGGEPRTRNSASVNLSASAAQELQESLAKSVMCPSDGTANEDTESESKPLPTDAAPPAGPTVMTLRRAGTKKLTVSFIGSHPQVFGTQVNVIKGGRGRLALQRTKSDHDLLNSAGGDGRDSFSEGSGRSASRYVATQSTDPASEHDMVTTTINEVKETEHCICFRIVMLLSGTTVLALLLLASIMVPFYYRKEEETALTNTMLTNSVIGRSLYVIINSLYSSVLDSGWDTSEFEAAVEFIREREGCPISAFMTRTQTFELKKTYSTTIYSVLAEFNSTTWSQERFWDYLAPIMIYFYDKSLQMLYSNELNSMLTMRYSDDVCYILVIILLIFFLVYISISIETLFRRAFNSLFHFPSEFVREMMANKTEKEESKFPLPNKVLIVTMMEQTKEIYSVSDNSVEILQRTPAELICRKFPDVFVTDTERSLLTYTSPDQKTKKQFKYSISHAGELVKVMMIEEQVLMCNSKTKNQQMTTKLSFFVALSYAREFMASGKRDWSYDHAIVIMLRVRPDAPKLASDKFYQVVHSQTQNYSFVECLKADGSTMTFAIYEEMFPMVGLFFIRDLIKEATNAAKLKGSVFMPVSFVITQVPSLVLRVVYKSEPYLNISYETSGEVAYLSYKLEQETVGFFACPFLEFVPALPLQDVTVFHPRWQEHIGVKTISFEYYMEVMARI